MKRTIIAALTITAATISTATLAANPWVKVGTIPYGNDVYYNTQTVGRLNDVVSVLTSGLYGSNQTTTEFINCKTWTHNIIQTTGKASPDYHILPNTPINTLAEKVCK